MADDYDEFLFDLARQQAGELDAAKLEIRLWLMVRGDQRAEVRTRRHPVGIELMLLVDNEVVSTAAFGPSAVHRLEPVADTIQRTLVAEGWQVAGPQRLDVSAAL